HWLCVRFQPRRSLTADQRLADNGDEARAEPVGLQYRQAPPRHRLRPARDRGAGPFARRADRRDRPRLRPCYSLGSSGRHGSRPAGRAVGGLKGDGGAAPARAFSPDGNTRASGSGDTTVLLWDIVYLRILKNALAPPGDPDRLWRDVAGDDSWAAWQAMWRLQA